MFDRFKIGLNYILPKKFLTELAGWSAGLHGRWFTKLAIDIFVWFYKIDMTEAIDSNTANYHTFNDFFSRPLKENVRPFDTDTSVLVVPCDGIISQLGCIESDQIFQAKNHYYSLQALLAGNDNLVEKFIDGEFITIYLTPGDYHRVHMPCDGILREMIYVPGELNSVNYLIVHHIPNLFARNERVICIFETNHGLMAQILVGAIIVGSIETTWAGAVGSPREGVIKRWKYPAAVSDYQNAISLLKGQEMGKFKLGSTVINLFTKNHIKLAKNLKSEKQIYFGQLLAVDLNHYNNC